MTISITVTSDDPKYSSVLALLEGNAKPSKPAKASPPEDKKEDKKEEEEEEEGSYAWEDLAIGMKVLVDFGDDGHVESEITSLPKKNKAQVQVTPDDTQEAEMVSIDDLINIIESEEEEEEEEEGEEGAYEFSPGDDVEFKQGRKKVQGTVKSVDDDKGTAKVKVPGTRTLSVVDLDDLALLTE